MRIILSKDRAAQLDLLLRSLDRNAPREDTFVLWKASDAAFREAYNYVSEYSWVHLSEEFFFERHIKFWLSMSADPFVTFFCDDDVVYRPLPDHNLSTWFYEEILCFSYRLGRNTTVQYPTGLEQLTRGNVWDWRDADGDFGYPGSVDGHVFRRNELRALLEQHTFPNPTALECAIIACCEKIRDRRPLMGCADLSSVVGVPVNRVSEQSNVRYGEKWAVDQATLNRDFLGGGRLSLDLLCGYAERNVDGAHTEMPFTMIHDPNLTHSHVMIG